MIPDGKFEPAKMVHREIECKQAPGITKQLTQLQIFHKVLFPRSLYLHNANITNPKNPKPIIKQNKT